MRIIRGNGGANTSSTIAHRGTGNLDLVTYEAANIRFKTDETTTLTLDSSQNATFEGDIEVRSGNKLILQRPNNGIASNISTDSTGAMVLDSLNSEGFFFNNAGTNAFKLDPITPPLQALSLSM